LKPVEMSSVDESSVIDYPDIEPTGGVGLRLGRHGGKRMSDLLQSSQQIDRSQVTNISIQDCENLEELDCIGSFHNVRVVIIHNCPRLQNISQIQQLNCLYVLSVTGTAITSLDCLLRLEHLIILNAAGCTNLEDVHGLRNASNLQFLSIAGSLVSSVAPLRRCRKLQQLDMSGTLVGDITPVCGHPELVAIDATDSGVSDLEGIEECRHIERLALSSIRRIEPLIELSTLQELYITGAKFTDAYELGEMPSLTTCVIVDPEGNPIKIPQWDGALHPQDDDGEEEKSNDDTEVAETPSNDAAQVSSTSYIGATVLETAADANALTSSFTTVDHSSLYGNGQQSEVDAEESKSVTEEEEHRESATERQMREDADTEMLLQMMSSGDFGTVSATIPSANLDDGTPEQEDDHKQSREEGDSFEVVESEPSSATSNQHVAAETTRQTVPLTREQELYVKWSQTESLD
jgi:hypothetical protein